MAPFALFFLALVRADDILFTLAPSLQTVEYILLDPGPRGLIGNAAPRSLIGNALVAPSALAVDAARRRLFVSDPGQQKILLYDLEIDVTGHVWTLSHRVALSDVLSDGLAVDAEGNLFFSGSLTRFVGGGDANATKKSVFRHGEREISDGQISDPMLLWDEEYSRGRAWAPGPIAVTTGFLVWGNLRGMGERTDLVLFLRYS